MDEELDLSALIGLFEKTTESGASVYALQDGKRDELDQLIPGPLRRCYASEEFIRTRAAANGLAPKEFIKQALIPDPGNVMSGDFGEVLTHFLQLAAELPREFRGARRWRWKEDRKKAASGSDVVLVFMADWGAPSTDDEVVCAEVKAKATPSNTYRPLKNAHKGIETDQKSRLANTLVWLRARSVKDGPDGLSVDQLDRFIESPKHGVYKKVFRAVAVIDESYKAAELAAGWDPPANPPEVVVVTVPDLKGCYTAAFESATELEPDGGAS